jgi:23S rRNA (adenine2030-N6)-methyltransferase
VLIDPPFEEEGEFARMADGLKKAHRRWPGGIYAFWYPIKDRAAVERFRQSLRETGIPKILDVSFSIRAPSPEARLDGCGMAIVNPPYLLQDELAAILPALTRLLGEDKGATWALEQIGSEAG